MEHIPIEIPRDNPGGGGPTTALCFDIGGSKYNVGLVDREGTVLDQEIGLWSAVSQEGVLADLLACGDRVLERNPDAVPAVIGATIPGLADPERGMWVEASFSGIRDFPIAQRLTERYRLPAYVDNDGQARALAERMFGCYQGVDDFLYLTVSNGVGGACFLNGNLYGGSSGGAGGSAPAGRERPLRQGDRPAGPGGGGKGPGDLPPGGPVPGPGGGHGGEHPEPGQGGSGGWDLTGLRSLRPGAGGGGGPEDLPEGQSKFDHLPHRPGLRRRAAGDGGGGPAGLGKGETTV